MSSKHLTPNAFTDWLAQNANHGITQYCLFLDIDGTLSPFELDPNHSTIPTATLEILAKLQQLAVPIAVVTGRSLVDARRMLAPLQLSMMATYGLEQVLLPPFTDNLPHIPTTNSRNSENNPPFTDNFATTLFAPILFASTLGEIYQTLQQACQISADFLIEPKPFSIALHYRKNPALAEKAQQIMAELIRLYPEWQLKQGKFVWEIVPKGADKGGAILSLLDCLTRAYPKTPFCPIFMGDDISDEAGFLAVQNYPSKGFHPCLHKGIGIKVGKPAIMSHATFYVQDIAEASQVLQQFLVHQQQFSIHK